jgi:hypothetical protein
VFVQKYATFLEKEFVLETSSERKIKLNEVEEPQINIQMEQVFEAITFDTQLETQKTQELYRFGRTRYAQLRYQLLMKVDMVNCSYLMSLPIIWKQYLILILRNGLNL